MPTVDFLPYGNAVGANVLSQPSYAAAADRASGMGTGLVPSPKLNKTLRQTSVMSAAIAQFISTSLAADVLDDGDVDALRAQLTAAIAAIAAGSGTGGVTIDALAASVALLQQGYVEPLTVSDVNRTFNGSDVGKLLRRSSASNMTDTIPDTPTIAVGRTITVRATGAGTYTVQAAAGVTLNVPTGSTATARVRHSTLVLHKVGAAEWDITGDLGAV